MNRRAKVLIEAMNPQTLEEWNRTKPDPPKYENIGYIEKSGRPIRRVLMRSCSRCGGLVTTETDWVHTEWHEEQALRVWLTAFLLDRIDRKHTEAKSPRFGW